MKKLLLLLPFVVLLAACSSESSKLMQQARGLEAKKPQDALKLYEKIVSDSPGSTEAPEALFHCAGLYKAVKNDLLKSASTYESIAERYPKSEYGHKGLFAAAFMYANEMNNYAKAKSLYEKYLTTYPDSALTKDVKFELTNLGKSADDLLKSLQDSAAGRKEQVVGK